MWRNQKSTDLSAEHQGSDVRVLIRSWKHLEMAFSTWDVREKNDHSISQRIWPGFPIFYKTPPKVKVELNVVKVTWTLSKRHMCKISNYQLIWMSLTRVLTCQYSHFSSPRRPLRTFCGSSSSNNNNKKTTEKNEHPLLKSTRLIYVWQHVKNTFVNGLFSTLR